MYMEKPARKKPFPSTTVPDIYRVSLLVLALVSAPFVLKPLFTSLQHFVAVTIPWARNSFSRWLTPPYLFFLLNCIILAIFVNSSGRHRKFNSELNNSHDEGRPQEPDDNRQFLEVKEIDIHSQNSAPEENEIIRKDSEEAEVIIDKGSVTPLLEVEKCAKSSEAAAAWKPAVGIASADADQSNKILASARFTRRKVSGHESGCKSLRVSQNHRDETLESVWKTITEGRHPPLTRHLRSTPDGSRNDHHSALSVRRRGEEESSGRRGSGSLKRETSVGVEDLNKRVEAFIHKFNAEMRLQKEHSLLHYMEMINRGAS